MPEFYQQYFLNTNKTVEKKAQMQLIIKVMFNQLLCNYFADLCISHDCEPFPDEGVYVG